MNNEEVRQIIEDRLAKVIAKAKAQEEIKNDVILGKHAQGMIDAMTGIGGEQQFLEKLLEEL